LHVGASQKEQQSDVNPKSYPEYIRPHEPQNVLRARRAEEGVAAGLTRWQNCKGTSHRPKPNRTSVSNSLLPAPSPLPLSE
jgi:hypothetical protein